MKTNNLGRKTKL